MNERPQRPSLPRWKRALFIAVAMALPFVALGVVEGALRLFGWGGYPDFIMRAGPLPQGGELCFVEPTAFKPYFFANPTRPGYTDQSCFVMPKPKGVVRILLAGESAAKGYPQPPNLAMSAFLQGMLQQLWPERKVEVINLGTTAVASFPIVYQVRQALQFEPDLLVLYVGNNEFFGAYGTASINAAGTLPTASLALMRNLRSLALVQATESLLRRRADADRTLMEEMIGQTVIGAASPLRAAAARNLQANLSSMLESARAAGVPAIVCTTASNESGLAPLGENEPGVPAERGALARFEQGRALAAAGDAKGAREAFLDARDLDTMPWRPIRATEQAIRDAAKAHGAVLCDVAERFRDLSADGATGWDLLDDHVHPSLRGQVEIARAIVQSMANLPAPLAVDPAAAASLAPWGEWAARQGANAWDDYRVRHTLRVLFGVSFMRRTNEAAFQRFDQSCRAFEGALPPALVPVVRDWQSGRPNAGGVRPITGMIGRVLLRQREPAKALSLYEIAQTQVPRYTSWHLEYIYFTLACRQAIANSLSEAERAIAADAIAEGRFLLAHGNSESGLTERYLGRLHQLRGEWSDAIPLLLSARPRMVGDDLVACDQALVDSYMMTGNRAAAIALTDEGMRNAGKHAPAYRQMRDRIGR